MNKYLPGIATPPNPHHKFSIPSKIIMTGIIIGVIYQIGKIMISPSIYPSHQTLIPTGFPQCWVTITENDENTRLVDSLGGAHYALSNRGKCPPPPSIRNAEDCTNDDEKKYNISCKTMRPANYQECNALKHLEGVSVGLYQIKDAPTGFRMCKPITGIIDKVYTNIF